MCHNFSELGKLRLSVYLYNPANKLNNANENIPLLGGGNQLHFIKVINLLVN